MKIKYKLIITFSLIIITSSLPLSIFILDRQEKENTAKLLQEGDAITRILSRSILNILVMNSGDIKTSRIDSNEMISFLRPYEKNGLIYADAFLISSKKEYDGTIIAQYKSESVKDSVFFLMEKLDAETAKELKKQDGPKTIFFPGMEGRHYQFVYPASLPNSTPLCMGRLIFSETFIKEPVDRMRKIIIMAAMASIGLVGIAGFYLSRKISKPLIDLTLAVQKIDTEGHAFDFAYDSRDEVGILARTVKDMAGTINMKVGELVTVNERLVKMDQMKDDFIANISHELRTPLYGISGITESLIEGITGPVNDRMKDQMMLILSSCRRLTVLVNDLLYFSKLKFHDIILKKSPVSVKTVAGHVISMLYPMYNKKNLAIANNIDDTDQAYADEDRLTQVMFNLLENAVKFTDSGSIVISSGPFKGNRDILMIKVQDTGIGIPAENMGTIFEPFTQAHGDKSMKYGGAGLGLAISKKIIELHEGEIWAESGNGTGTAFCFTLKRYTGFEAEVPGGPATGAQEIMGLEDEIDTGETVIIEDTEAPKNNITKQILVVDDEPVNQRVISNHLKLEGYWVISSKTGANALEVIMKGPVPDLVLLDIMLPDISGYDLCRKIREKFMQHEVPIIMITSKALPQDIAAGFEAGANDYITKPVEREILIARVKNLVSMRESVLTWNKLNIIKEELIIATDIQSSILPRALPQCKNIDIALKYIPAMEIGGDFYKFRVIDDLRLGVLIADASGHGIPAAMMCAMYDVAYSFHKDTETDPATLNQKINVTMSMYNHQYYLTSMYVFIDLKEKKLTLSNAGHKPLLLYRKKDDTLTSVHTKGIPIGIFSDAAYVNTTVDIEDGDRIVLHTDGITDIKRNDIFLNKNNDFQDLIHRNGSLSPGEFADLVMETVKIWAGTTDGSGLNDDATLIVLDIRIPS